MVRIEMLTFSGARKNEAGGSFRAPNAVRFFRWAHGSCCSVDVMTSVVT